MINFLYHNLHNIGYQITQQNKYDIIIVKIQFTPFGIIMLGFIPSSEVEGIIIIYGPLKSSMAKMHKRP